MDEHLNSFLSGSESAGSSQPMAQAALVPFSFIFKMSSYSSSFKVIHTQTLRSLRVLPSLLLPERASAARDKAPLRLQDLRLRPGQLYRDQRHRAGSQTVDTGDELKKT